MRGPDHHNGLGRTVLAGVFFAAAAGLLAARAWALVNVPGAPDHARWVLQDFRDAIYYPVVALLDGGNPYDVAAYYARYPVGQEFPVYSPLTLLVHLPFGLLPYRLAEALYFAVTLALTVVLAGVSLRLAGLPQRADAVLTVAALLLLSRPGQSNLLLGQSTLLAVLATVTALHWARSHPWRATAALALATFKPTFGIPLAVLLALRGDVWVAARGLAIGGAVAALVAVWPAAGAGGVEPFLRALLDNQSQMRATPQVDPATSWLRIDSWALAARLAGRSLGVVVESVLSLVVLGGTGLLLRRAARGTAESAGHVTLALASAGILAGLYHQVYDLLLLAPATVAVLSGRPADLWAARPLWRAGLAVALIGLFANYATTNTALSRLGIGGGWWLVIVSINGLLLLAVWLAYAGLALRLGRSGARVPAERRRVWTRRRVGVAP